MSTKDQAQPAKPQEQAANKGVAAVLSDEALHNLTGWFDVLIRMDFAQKQRNELRSKYGTDKVSKTGTTTTHSNVPQSTGDRATANPTEQDTRRGNIRKKTQGK